MKSDSKLNKSLYAALSIFLGVLMGVLFLYLLTWKIPGISFSIYVLVYFLGILIPFIVVEDDLKSVFREMGLKLLLVPGFILSSTLFAYRLSGVWLVFAFLILPVIYTIGVLYIFGNQLFKNFSIFSFLISPVVYFISLIGGLFQVIRNISIVKIAQKLTGKNIRKALLGGIIAIPFLIIFGILFSTADANFQELITKVLDKVNIFKALGDNFAEHAGRIIVGLIVTVYTIIFYFALWNKDSVVKRMLKKSLTWKWLYPTTKWDGVTVSSFLTFINLLFALFVGLQFSYLFGGRINVLGDQAAHTFAEYARKGFWELLVVAMITYGLLFITDFRTKLKSRRQKLFYEFSFFTNIFLILSIIVSSWIRLSLYEYVYGFTALRLLVNWAILLISIYFIVLVIGHFLKDSWNFVNKTLLIISTVFIVLWLMIPLDFFIANLNYKRYVNNFDKCSGRRYNCLDVEQLTELSDEAIPVMLKMIDSGKVDNNTEAILNSELYSRYSERYSDEVKHPDSPDTRYHWQSFNIFYWYNKNQLEKRYSKSSYKNQLSVELGKMLQEYTGLIKSKEYEKAYSNYWSQEHTEPANWNEYRRVVLTRYDERVDSGYFPYYNFEVGGNSKEDNWLVVEVHLDIEADQTSVRCNDYYEDEYSRYGYGEDKTEELLVIYDKGKWKITDAYLITLGEIKETEEVKYDLPELYHNELEYLCE